MPQTILSVVLEVAAPNAPRLRAHIRRLTADAETTTPKYQRLRQAVPLLHFMSMTVFAEDQYDPVFILEANFDGPPGPFWTQLEAAFGSDMRDMLRCAKPPPGRAGKLFAAAVAAGSAAPLTPLLEACTVRPAVFHQGNRGLDRGRIEREDALFTAARVMADDPALRAETPAAIHGRLREALAPRFPWLNTSAPARISVLETLGDWLRLIGFLGLAVLVPCLPGLWLAPFLKAFLPPLVTIALAAALSLAGVGVWLRALERADPWQDAPPRDEIELAALERTEDRIAQNHMLSIVHIKPGLLRAVLVRAGLWGLGYILRVRAHSGYLASMRTIHFAHWAIVGNGGRLMFHSNFDGSWESYLDDFIEKAHMGLTLAWTNGVGFPATRFLILDGATAGRKFKAWARHSMRETLFWFSAYERLSVNQIERQARVAEGLRRRTLSSWEAAAWALDL